MSEEDQPLLEDGKNNIFYSSTPSSTDSSVISNPILSLTSKKVVNGSMSTVFLMLNVMVGAGFLVQPYVFKEAGIILATIYFAVFGCASYYAAEIIVTLAKCQGIYNYSELVHAYLGDWGMLFLDLTMIFSIFGVTLLYTLLLAQLTRTVLTDYMSSHQGTLWYTNEMFWTTIWLLFVVFPLCLAKKFGNLASIAYYSMSVIVSFCILVYIVTPSYYYKENEDDPVKYANWVDSLSAMGSILFALTFQRSILPAYESAHPNTQKNFNYYLMITIILGTAVYFSVGFVGYICFRNSVEVDVLTNFSDNVSNTTLKGIGTFFQCVVSIHLAFVIPGNFVILRMFIFSFQKYLYRVLKISYDSVNDADDGSDKGEVEDVSVLEFMVLTLIIIFGIYLIAISIEATFGDNTNAVWTVVGLSGGVADTAASFIIPGLIGIVHTSYPHLFDKHTQNNRENSSRNSNSSDDKDPPIDLQRLKQISWGLFILSTITSILVVIGTVMVDK